MVGEAGVSPEYFHRSLTFHEANLIIKGLHRRYRAQWETARWQTTFIAKCAGNKDYTPPEFPWEKAQVEVKPYTEADIENLRREAQEWTAMLNARS